MAQTKDVVSTSELRTAKMHLADAIKSLGYYSEDMVDFGTNNPDVTHLVNHQGNLIRSRDAMGALMLNIDNSIKVIEDVNREQS